ncbi:hypothetical protein TNCV_460411 [Trichonephila clavipes]|nr:hypothetical protein TNCV_460411 [Trichonephila clavipes]
MESLGPPSYPPTDLNRQDDEEASSGLNKLIGSGVTENISPPVKSRFGPQVQIHTRCQSGFAPTAGMYATPQPSGRRHKLVNSLSSDFQSCLH